MNTIQSVFNLIHSSDSVAVALHDLNKGQKIEIGSKTISLRGDIPTGHKFAIQDIQKGSHVNKYGYPIGAAKRDIKAGEWVHTDNLLTNLDGTLDYEYKKSIESVKSGKKAIQTFNGFTRENGDVGIRNEIWIINTVGCINKTAELLAKTANHTFIEEDFDGFYHFPHPFGCSQLGDDLKNTQKTLRNLVQHPNAGGILVLGLGCENNNIPSFKEEIGEIDDQRVKFLAVQEVGDELEEGLTLISELVDYVKQFKREAVPISKLKIGLKCGGSDGFSGITANPLVGSFSDKLIESGGTTILTEVPEMFGAEKILMNRAKDEEVFEGIVHLINDFKEYFLRHDQPVYENPSPGNKDGGITTLEEKSLGCVQKGGSGEVVDVLQYGDIVQKQGLNLLQGPGNDLVSVTSLAASGAHIVLFTTGRGTPFGGPVPTVKISTNTQLFERKKNWIDYNAGQMLEGKSREELTDDLFNYIINVASGEKRTNNEEFGFKEISIFKDGVFL